MKDLWKPKVENFQRIFSLSFVVEENQRLSGSVWPDCWIICLIFGHLKHWKIAQEHLKFAKVSTKCFQILNEHFQKGQVFNAMPKWQNFAKSGHTTLDLDNFAHAGQSKCRWSAGAHVAVKATKKATVGLVSPCFTQVEKGLSLTPG